ncbi:hypothetical protein [Microcoleus sp. FACHB-68]|nr:hypothetical protein [Microcoleus sp. FACHB-68]
MKNEKRASKPVSNFKVLAQKLTETSSPLYGHGTAMPLPTLMFS